MRLLSPAALLAACVLALGACTGAQTDGASEAPPAAASAPAATTQDARVARADSARILGAADAPVWLIEVSDYQCPFCRTWHEETFPVIQREYIEPGRVRFAYVHFPLGSHPHAPLAAEAAMCAGAQGRFWELHDLLFDAQPQWAPLADAEPAFDSLAARAGLDMAQYAECLESDVMVPVVQADRERMRAAGVGSTPTFFIGDQRIEGAQPAEVFRAALDAALAATPAAGAAPDSARQP